MEKKHHPPPSSSSEATQKSIYLWFRKFEEPHSDVKTSRWYKLDPTQLNSEETQLKLISKCTLSFAASAVAWRSTIYVIGGNPSRRLTYSPRRNLGDEKLNWSREVYYFDTRCPHLGWKNGPTLNSSRTKVDPTVKGGKIYAFRGRELKGDGDTVDKSYGEVLDPLLWNNWMPIRGPDDPKLCYDYENDTWGPLNLHEEENLDDIVLSRDVWGLCGKLVRPPPLYQNCYPEFTVGIGDGRFCFLWESERGLHCTKFRASVHDDGDGKVCVLGTIEAFKIFRQYEPRISKEPWQSRNHLVFGKLKNCLVL